VATKEAMYAAYQENALRQWIVDVERSNDAPNVIYLRGHCPANGTRHGFIMRGREDIPSRLLAVRGLKGVTRIEDGFYTSTVYCEPERRASLVEEIQARLVELGFITSDEWEGIRADYPPNSDPRPPRHPRRTPR
jgi:hypothetical protein